MTRLLVATRSAHKLREIRQILHDLPALELIDLREAGVPRRDEEEEIEVFDTFHENALAKARYFARETGLATLADDSGICVDALGGAPGVRSKRFSGRQDLSGGELDAANNALLLEGLAEVPAERRTARYVCAVAVVDSQGEERVFRGECEGVVLREPRGTGGFGYDPLFYVPAEERTMGELSAERKNQISHRAAALREAAEMLRGLR